MSNEDVQIEDETPQRPTVTPRVLDFEETGPLPSPEEQRAFLLKWREEQKAKAQGKQVNGESSQEAERLAKLQEANRLKLQALQIQKDKLDIQQKEIEIQEREIREAALVLEKTPETERRREKRVRDDEDESWNSESYSRRSRSRVVHTSDSEEDRPQMQDRMTRMEKAMFGERRISHEPVVTEEIEQFRPPPGRQFPKMHEFNGKGDPEDHCEKYEDLMTGMGHCDIMLCKMFKTYLKGPATMWYRSLRPRSIGSYDHLKRKFLRHYSHLCRREKDTEALIHCRQGANEELGVYLARFKEEAGMVTNLDKVKAAGFLTAGLDPKMGKKLRSSLYDMPPKSLNDIYLRGEAIRRKMESIGGYKEEKKDSHRDSRSDDRMSRGDIKSRLTYTRPGEGAEHGDKDVEHRADRPSTHV